MMAQFKIKILPIYSVFITVLAGYLGHSNWNNYDLNTEFELAKLDLDSQISSCKKSMEEYQKVVQQRESAIVQLKEDNKTKCDLESIIIRRRDKSGKVTEEREFMNSN